MVTEKTKGLLAGYGDWLKPVAASAPPKNGEQGPATPLRTPYKHTL